MPDEPDDEPLEQWLLFGPSGHVLTVRDDGTYAYKPGDTPPEEEVWRPL